MNQSSSETVAALFSELEENVENKDIDTNGDESEDPNVTVDVELEVETAPDSPQIGWTSELSEEGVQIELSEFGKQAYTYIPLNTLNGKFSGYYFCQCVDSTYNDTDGNAIEFASSGLLSKRYTIANMEKFIGQLKTCVDLKNEPKLYHYPFYMNCQVETTINDLKVLDKEATDMILGFISGVDEESLSNLNTELVVSATNNYSGARSLTVDMILKTTGKSGENEFKFRDFFTLMNHRQKVNHISTLSKMSSSLTNVQPKIDESIKLLRSIDSNNPKLKSIVEGFGNKFLKENKDRFFSHWELVVGDLRNLYNALLIASVVLSENYNTKDHANVGNYINAQLKKL